MEIIDISRDILKTSVYPGDPEGYLDEIKSMKKGEKCNLNAFYTCLHTATHIDAPLHFISDGASIEEIPLATFIGECVVVEAPPGPVTGAFAEDNFPFDAERILLKGNGNSYLMESSAYCFADTKVKLIGTDAQSIGHGSSNEIVHRALLTENISVLEGLDLSKVEQGKYFLMAQPIKISGVEASPCRAILIKDHLFWTGTR